MTIQDPTREDMLAFLQSSPYTAEAGEFDIEAAIYFFASHYHGGQASNLYTALCSSLYRPAWCARGPADGMQRFLYETLETEYAPKSST